MSNVIDLNPINIPLDNLLISVIVMLIILGFIWIWAGSKGIEREVAK